MGAGYDIPLSKLITLAPQLTFGYGVSDVIEDVDYSNLIPPPQLLMSPLKFLRGS
jgi:hypothetical protein